MTATQTKRKRGRPRKTTDQKLKERNLWMKRCHMEGWRPPRLNHVGWIPEWTLSRLKKRWAEAYSEA